MKTRIEEVQDKMMAAFTVAMMCLFFAIVAAGCGTIAAKSAAWWRAVPLFGTALLLLWPLVLGLRAFLRHGAEEERLSRQQPEDG